MDQTTKYDLEFAKGLMIGELIAISHTNWLRIAVFAGIGIANNVQYYNLPYYFNSGTKKLSKHYIGTDSSKDKRVCRFNIEDLPDELEREYHLLIEEMKKQGLISQDFPIYK